MLGRWTREPEAREDGAFPGNGRLALDQEELHRLRGANRRLRMAREMFKKAAACFANEST
jgi:transposase